MLTLRLLLEKNKEEEEKEVEKEEEEEEKRKTLPLHQLLVHSTTTPPRLQHPSLKNEMDDPSLFNQFFSLPLSQHRQKRETLRRQAAGGGGTKQGGKEKVRDQGRVYKYLLLLL